MRNILFLAFSIPFSFLFLQPAKADLEGADLTLPAGGTGNTYEAWCGQDRNDCKVKFVGNRLVVNDGKGITKDQMTRIHKTLTCRQKSFGSFGPPSCFKSQYDKDYSLSYDSSSGVNKTALITIRHQKTADDFDRDLQIFIGDFLREIGPSFTLE